MKTKYNLIAAASVGALPLTTTAQAQQVPQPKTAAEVPGPVPGGPGEAEQTGKWKAPAVERIK